MAYGIGVTLLSALKTLTGTEYNKPIQCPDEFKRDDILYQYQNTSVLNSVPFSFTCIGKITHKYFKRFNLDKLSLNELRDKYSNKELNDFILANYLEIFNPTDLKMYIDICNKKYYEGYIAEEIFKHFCGFLITKSSTALDKKGVDFYYKDLKFQVKSVGPIQILKPQIQIPSKVFPKWIDVKEYSFTNKHLIEIEPNIISVFIDFRNTGSLILDFKETGMILKKRFKPIQDIPHSFQEFKLIVDSISKL